MNSRPIWRTKNRSEYFRPSMTPLRPSYLPPPKPLDKKRDNRLREALTNRLELQALHFAGRHSALRKQAKELRRPKLFGDGLRAMKIHFQWGIAPMRTQHGLRKALRRPDYAA